MNNSENFSYSPIASTSAYLRNSFGTSDSGKKKIAQKEVLLDVLREINKTCNLIQNSTDEDDEKKLRVLFSDGHSQNSFDSPDLFVSPEILKDENGVTLNNKSQEFFDAVDALNGQVLLCCFMKQHVPNKVAEDLNNMEDCWGIFNIFCTDLQNVSLKQISFEWPGFESYVSQVKEKFFSKKEVTLYRFSQKPVSVDNFVSLLCFNILSNDKIVFEDWFVEDLAERLDRCQSFLTTSLNTEIQDEFRLVRAVKLYDEIEKILDLPTVQNPDLTEAPNLTQKEMEDNSDESDLIAGDNSFNPDKKIEGEFQAWNLRPEKQVNKQRKKHHDSLKAIQSSIFDGRTFMRIEPATSENAQYSYNNIVQENAHIIRSVQNSFKFQNTEFAIDTFGLPQGSLDDNSLHKIHLQDYDHLYTRKEIKSKKKWLVTTLLDQSGSMNGVDRIVEARKLSIIFAEALKTVHDIDFTMYGFSGSSQVEAFCFKERNYSNLPALAEAGTHSETPMGPSMVQIADKMLTQYPEVPNKILFLITDGQPSHIVGTNCTPIEHTKQCCELVRSKNIKVFGIGICKAFNHDVGEEIFGANNFVVINDVENCLNVLVNSLAKFLKRVG